MFQQTSQFKLNNYHFTLVLVEPQIPQNAGSIARLCAATNCKLHFVGKLGFELSDKYLKRAGLDYWPYVDWEYYPDINAYISQITPNDLFLSTKGDRYFTDEDCDYKVGTKLIFGSETAGMPSLIYDKFFHQYRKIPMIGAPEVRSLNLANSASIVAYHGLYRLGVL